MRVDRDALDTGEREPTQHECTGQKCDRTSGRERLLKQRVSFNGNMSK